MRSIVVAALLNISVVACVDGQIGNAPTPPDATIHIGAQVAGAADEPSLGSGSGSNDCALLPHTGACSLACDPQKMAEDYLPPGVCALFACPLSDGRTMTVGVCH